MVIIICISTLSVWLHIITIIVTALYIISLFILLLLLLLLLLFIHIAIATITAAAIMLQMCNTTYPNRLITVKADWVRHFIIIIIIDNVLIIFTFSKSCAVVALYINIIIYTFGTAIMLMILVWMCCCRYRLLLQWTKIKVYTGAPSTFTSVLRCRKAMCFGVWVEWTSNSATELRTLLSVAITHTTSRFIRMME